MSSAQTDDPAPAPVADLSYEQARDELVRLVSRIESGQVPLEEAMVLWERGEQLAAHCQAKLDAAQHTLDRATGQGEPVAAEGGAGKPAERDADDGDAEDGDHDSADPDEKG